MILERPLFHLSILLLFILIVEGLRIEVKVTSFWALKFKKRERREKASELYYSFPFFRLLKLFFCL